MLKYSIIIPVLNEKKNINVLIKKISKFLIKKRYETIVIDDDSSDGSEDLFKKLSKSKKNFSYYVRKNKTKDLTQSVILGIEKSKFKNIIVMDGDLQHDPKYLPILIDVFQKKKLNLLIATRNFKKRQGLSLFRFNASKLLIFLINKSLKKITTDPMSGFFIIKKRTFMNCKKKLYGKGFKILFDIIYSGKLSKILDFEIKFKTRLKHKSKMSFKVLFHLINIFLFRFFKKNFS